MWTLCFPVNPWIPRNVFYLCHGVCKSVQLHWDGQCRVWPTRVGPCSLPWKDCPYLWKPGTIYLLSQEKPVALLVSVRDGSYVQQSPWLRRLSRTGQQRAGWLRDKLSSSFSVLKDPRSRQWFPPLAWSCAWSMICVQQMLISGMHGQAVGVSPPVSTSLSDGWGAIVCSSHCYWRRSMGLVQQVTGGIGQS